MLLSLAGQLDPLMANTSQIAESMELIKNINLQAQFPIEKEEINLIEITKIADIIILLKDNKLVYDIEIPLLTGTELTLFELHQVPTKQNIFRNQERVCSNYK